MIKKIIRDSNSVTWCRIAATIIILFAAKNVFFSVIHWKNMEGWEAYWIAQAIANGEGYSFPSAYRWLFDSIVDGKYHPTAWIDPVYTYCLAGLIWLFGDYHQLAAAIFNMFLYVVIFILTYHLAERLISSKAAVLTVVLLAISYFFSLASYMNNPYLATSFILLSAVVLVNYFERPSLRNAVILGVVLGLTVLACPSAQFFIPVTAISILFWGRGKLKSSVLYSIIVCVVSVAIIAPWTIRNYLLFDEFVPVRSGAGQIIFIGVVAVAATVIPEKIASSTKPAWKEKTARKAVFNIRNNTDAKRSLEKFQMEYANEVGPDQWSDMNEAQRDKWFLREAKEFIYNNPLISVQLAMAKIEVFVRSMKLIGVAILLLAILGALVTLRNPAIFTVTLWVSFYIGPFLLIIAYYSRYRAPIEPLLSLLATFALYWIFQRLGAVLRQQ